MQLPILMKLAATLRVEENPDAGNALCHRATRLPSGALPLL